MLWGSSMDCTVYVLDCVILVKHVAFVLLNNNIYSLDTAYVLNVLKICRKKLGLVITSLFREGNG